VGRLKVGIIGCGYWGPNLVRTFMEIPDASVRAIADHDWRRLEEMRLRHPQVKHFELDHQRLCQDGLDIAVVSTPPETHFDVVSDCLNAGLDVLVEKPLAMTSYEGARLIDLAESNGRILMVGHIAAYNPVVVALKEMVDSGELGEIRYVDTIRAGLGVFRSNTNVVWDLAPHDISILLHVLGSSPWSVSAVGKSCVQDSVEDVAYLSMKFDGDVLAHARMSWVDPYKTRKITIVGSRKMVVYDDLEPLEKLKVYDKSVNAVRKTDTFGEYQFAYHYGSVVSPYVRFEEPLRMECLHLIDCIRERKPPLTDGRNGLDVVRVIEAAQRSLAAGGIEISVDAGAGSELSDLPARDADEEQSDDTVLDLSPGAVGKGMEAVQA
jgi:predicted dehydrogenase